MSQIYFCCVSDSDRNFLSDSVTDSSACLLSSLDFPQLFAYGYNVTIVDIFVPLNPSHQRRVRRLSRRISDYICKFGKLPNYKRL